MKNRGNDQCFNKKNSKLQKKYTLQNSDKK